MATQTVTLASETDWSGFRGEARALLARQVPPEDVVWHTRASAAGDLFGALEARRPATASSSASAVVPPAFVRLCETVVLHQDPARFGLLYRLLWRLVHEPGLRHDPLDPERVRVQHMAQAVRREMHKMKAFVRFRPLAQGEGQPPLHVAWFEPEHHIVEAVAPFFVRRFASMHWAILTPDRSVRWHSVDDGSADASGGRLDVGPGARREDAPPADAGEAHWLTYYQHIFNPARLKLAMMQKEMPRRYWQNLPEAALISPLTADAMARSGRMIEAPPTTPARRIVPLMPAGASESLNRGETLAAFAEPLSSDPAEALAQLKRATDRCRECPIGEHATQSVFGEGPPGAVLMVVGEQPGDQEDLRGRPFVGPAGQLFDRAIGELGWPREALYVTNAVKHFKFELRGKRRIHKTPTQREAAACLHWLESEMAQVRPRAVLALGATAARSVLGRPVAVLRERGQWQTGPHGEQVLVTLHPSALLRGDPAQRDEAYAAWLEDLGKATALVRNESPEVVAR
ncbi:UdgX family uracil-DNA binding protein [Variovorax sp. ZT4R33]|uniref:UdgX family uracil-DNA binding protein n=1 Tax=Variovorax sp. ZT4R33 TaxID=3443743 RepID=UPI003F4680F8